MLKAAKQLHLGQGALSIPACWDRRSCDTDRLLSVCHSLASEALLVSLMECAISQDGQSFCQYMVLAEMQPLGLEKKGLAGVQVGVWRSQCEGPPGWAHGWEELGEQAELMCRRREGENLNRVCCRQRACSWVWENILWAMPFYCFGSWGHTVISNN